jgi:RNA polymerase sigma factor (sigma-70 family)
LLPDEPEVAGLLALMLLTDARRLARSGPDAELIPLDEQDRSRWDQTEIAQGVALLERTLPLGRPGPYQLQAAIAAIHDEAASVDDTDWRQILALYDGLKLLSDNPLIELNRAIAAAMVDGPRRGLELLEPLEQDKRFAGSHRLDAVRAHLLERAGDIQRAIACYGRAASRTTSIPERDYLVRKAARLAEKTPGGPDSESELFAVLGKGIHFLLLRQLRNQADSEDGVQHCFMVALSAIRNGSLREPAAVAGFVVTVARRYAAQVIQSRVKTRNRYIAVQDTLIPVGAAQEADRYRKQKTELLRAALLRLSASDREILYRYYLQEETEEEIRQAMCLTETQFRLRKSRAKAHLAREVERLSRPSIAGKLINLFASSFCIVV